MLRLVFTAAFGLLFSLTYGQLKKFYTLKEDKQFDVVDFSLEATAGNCIVKSAPDADPLTIYGNPDLEKINPSFKTSVVNGVCKVDLNLEEFRSSNVGDGILLAMFGEQKENNFWKILFDQDKIYKLNLSYGFGNADVDLSGISVKNFKVKSGSADILVDYQNGQPNKIEMDTFWVKADMGSIIAKHLELARAKYVMANIGFGRALLDFSATNEQKCTVDASVGAGNLDIFLPSVDVPMIIYLKDSPLCGMRLAKGFEEVERNVFVNMNYKADAANLLTFKVDVALGNVAFHYVD
jgi:hypothetical protein